jgi:hypothetical protein
VYESVRGHSEKGASYSLKQKAEWDDVTSCCFQEVFRDGRAIGGWQRMADIRSRVAEGLRPRGGL